MQTFVAWTLAVVLLCSAKLVVADEAAKKATPAVEWEFTQLEKVGGYKTTLVGSPRIIETPPGKAVEFDGQSGLFLDTNPLAGLTQFTAEVIFQPSAAGAKEQRFLHFQEEG